MSKSIFRNLQKGNDIPLFPVAQERCLGELISHRFVREAIESSCVGLLLVLIITQSWYVSLFESQLLIIALLSVSYFFAKSSKFSLFIGALLSHAFWLYFVSGSPLWSILFLVQALLPIPTDDKAFSWSQATSAQLVAQLIAGDVLIVLCLTFSFFMTFLR